MKCRKSMYTKHLHSVARVSYSSLTQKKLDWIMMRKWLNQLRNDLMANLTANRGTGVRRSLAHALLGLNNELEKLSMGGASRGGILTRVPPLSWPFPPWQMQHRRLPQPLPSPSPC